MPENHAAWQDQVGVPFSIRQTPYPTDLNPTQILIKVHAWAMNPADHLHIPQGISLPFVKYPITLTKTSPERYKPSAPKRALASTLTTVSSLSRRGQHAAQR